MSRQATCLHCMHRKIFTFIITPASVMKVLSKHKILQNKMQTTELCYLPLDKDKSGRYHVQWQPLLEGRSHFFLRCLAFRHNVSYHKLVTTLIAFHHNTASVDHVELQQCCLYSLQRVPSDTHTALWVCESCKCQWCVTHHMWSSLNIQNQTLQSRALYLAEPSSEIFTGDQQSWMKLYVIFISSSN